MIFDAIQKLKLRDKMIYLQSRYMPILFYRITTYKLHITCIGLMYTYALVQWGKRRYDILASKKTTFCLVIKSLWCLGRYKKNRNSFLSGSKSYNNFLPATKGRYDILYRSNSRIVFLTQTKVVTTFCTGQNVVTTFCLILATGNKHTVNFQNQYQIQWLFKSRDKFNDFSRCVWTLA